MTEEPKPVGSGRFRVPSQDSFVGPGTILVVVLFAQAGAWAPLPTARISVHSPVKQTPSRMLWCATLAFTG